MWSYRWRRPSLDISKTNLGHFPHFHHSRSGHDDQVGVISRRYLRAWYGKPFAFTVLLPLHPESPRHSRAMQNGNKEDAPAPFHTYRVGWVILQGFFSGFAA